MTIQCRGCGNMKTIPWHLAEPRFRWCVKPRAQVQSKVDFMPQGAYGIWTWGTSVRRIRIWSYRISVRTWTNNCSSCKKTQKSCRQEKCLDRSCCCVIAPWWTRLVCVHQRYSEVFKQNSTIMIFRWDIFRMISIRDIQNYSNQIVQSWYWDERYSEWYSEIFKQNMTINIFKWEIVRSGPTRYCNDHIHQLYWNWSWIVSYSNEDR